MCVYGSNELPAFEIKKRKSDSNTINNVKNEIFETLITQTHAHTHTSTYWIVLRTKELIERMKMK